MTLTWLEPEEAEAVAAPLESVTDKLMGWLSAAIDMLPNLGVAMLILVAFWFIARATTKWTRRGLQRTHLGEQLTGLTVSLLRVLVLAIGFVLALNALHLDRAVATALAGVGVVGLALGFAFQDIASNLVSGVIIAVKRPFEIGHVIETTGFTGTVEDIGLRATTLRKFSGEIVLIPNSKVFSEPMTNATLAEHRRIELAVGASYGDDLELVETTARKAVEGIADRVPDRDVQILFREFGSSSIDFEVRFWVPYQEDPYSWLRGRSEAIKAIKKAFDAAGLTIPFPIRTVDFGIIGGEPLGEAMAPVLDKLATRRAS